MVSLWLVRTHYRPWRGRKWAEKEYQNQYGHKMTEIKVILIISAYKTLLLRILIEKKP